MRYRQLPRTELTLSEIGVQAADLVTRQPLGSPEDAQRLLRHAYDLGITYFDTSDSEGNGESETLLAAALGQQRHDLVIGAKVGYDWQMPLYLRPPSRDARLPQDWSPTFIGKACESSLRRLRTDYIDIYTLHHPGMRALEREELVDTLETIRKKGQIRCWGVTLGPGTNWDEEGEMAIQERKAVVVQAEYNILRQKPTSLLFPLATKHKGGVIGLDPLEGGLLSEHYRAGLDVRLRELAFLDHQGIPLAHGAIRFALADPAVVSAVVPCTSGDKLSHYAAAGDLPPLSTADLEQLRDLYSAGFGVQGKG